MAEETAIKKAALNLLEKLKEQIMTDCTDEEITEALAKFNPECHGYVKESDFMNYDQALEYLHLGQNRTKLNELCKSYGIKCTRFNNASIGFPKKDIVRLGEIFKEEVEKRKKKQLRKEGQHRFLY